MVWRFLLGAHFVWNVLVEMARIVIANQIRLVRSFHPVKICYQTGISLT